jgi:PPOX class probable F420-dependent enzyme, Rv2061 family
MTTAPSTPTLDELGSAKYVSLTTYRKDGTPVPTPVWVVRDGDELAVWTNARTGKVKRLRRNSTVTVATCTFRGKPRSAPVPARAELMPPERVGRVLDLIKRKYGISGRILVLRAQRSTDGSAVGIRVTLSPAPEGQP